MFDTVQRQKTGSHQKKLGHGIEHILICIMKFALQPKLIDRLINLISNVRCYEIQ